MTIEELFEERSKSTVNHNDIWEHMGTLRRYAQKVTTICEIGTRTGNSTTAFLAGLSGRSTAMISYDIRPQVFTPPDIPGINWLFKQADSNALDFKISRCELLFIDGCHQYDSVKSDLKQSEYVWRYIILHDTSKARDEEMGDGVCKAMDEFLANNPRWKILERFDNCNGLTILERK